jgi:chemotaxis protein methyltransferase CheR
VDAITITDQEFSQFQKLFHQIAGINLSDAKKPLVCGRLGKRLKHYRLGTYGEYYRLLMNGQHSGELQTAIDLLTTNETHFFRESKHFDFLREKILPGWKSGRQFRVWSAACSSGEEPYSIAMTVASHLPNTPWEVLGSDICTAVLEKARAGHYPMDSARSIPANYLAEYCLKGIGAQEGTFLIDGKLRNRVKFMQINLNNALPSVGEFDVIFLRNVMIYFDLEMKRRVVGRLLQQLRSGGFLIIGHSESLNGVTDDLQPVATTVYRRP